MKKRPLPRVYWDSSCFIAWLKPEPERRKLCREVITAAEDGEIEIVTSAVALVEVIKLDKGPLQISADKAKKIRDFFRHRWIVVVQVTRQIGENARELVWTHGLKPRDSIHLATAMWAKEHGGLDEVHSYDEGMRQLDGTFGDGTLHVVEPRGKQALLFDHPTLSEVSDDEEQEKVH